MRSRVLLISIQAKETKVDKKVDPKAIPPIIIVPEIQWNLESLDEFPDPNHGPTAVEIFIVCVVNLSYFVHVLIVSEFLAEAAEYKRGESL